MLRDRIPNFVNFALKWCKAKEAWLTHVYKNHIWLFVSNEERLAATRQVLGYHKDRPREFKFEDTIAWESLIDDNRVKDEDLTPEYKQYWDKITPWVSWFTTTVPDIWDTYKLCKNKGTDITDIKRTIMLNYLYSYCPTKEDNEETRKKKNKYINDLTDFLIDCFEQLK